MLTDSQLKAALVFINSLKDVIYCIPVNPCLISPPDCGIVTSRLQVNLDDLLWVLTDSQLKAALVFINSLKDIIYYIPVNPCLMSPPDCGIVTSRLQVNLDDLLWVLTDSQLKAALVFINSLKDVIYCIPVNPFLSPPPDCGIVTSRLQVNLDDLLWVLTDSQLKAALVFINSLKDVIYCIPVNPCLISPSRLWHRDVASPSQPG